MTVYGAVKIDVIDDVDEIAKHNPPKGKPFLRLTFEDPVTGEKVTVQATTNLLEMIGGAAAGTRIRHEGRS